jgi:hypothetical protein
MAGIRSYDYVNHPYERVRDVLRADALEVFQAATRAAYSRAESLSSELRLEVGSIGIATDILIDVEPAVESVGQAGPTTRIGLNWQAKQRPHLFPLMDAVLAVYPLTGTETQLEFDGRYEPPLGILGSVIDAVVGKRIAEACVQRFVVDVARHLRVRLGE